MANYANDQDLVKIRPNILTYGVTDWEDQHVEAKAIISRALETRWYKEASADHGLDWQTTQFDSDLVDASFVKRLACYKALELIYQYLMTDNAEEDAFARQMHLFRALYEDELQAILTSGLGYDWDASGVIDTDERLEPRVRRLMRM